ncbi:fungal-specific transcription factor domain-containing protein [Mycena amicta]|nr:fungal-specific transcription factor domain-containing protein [Mycena amicta]
MSSDDDVRQLDDDRAQKRRNVVRACDLCRKKKIRCDGPNMSQCSSCAAYGYDCTYVEAAKKRGPPKAYIEKMEIRIQKIERLLQTLLPDTDLTQLLSDPSAAGWKLPRALEEDDRAHLSLTENLQRLSLSPDADTIFFGRSSGAMLLRTALNVKQDAEPQNSRRHTEFWASRPSPETPARPKYAFPPQDLAETLIQFYFANINLLLPLLHRPTFDRNVAAGLHLTNDGFAATYLLVCALGSRYSEDKRVLLDGTDDWHSCGWRWFEQLQLVRDPLGAPVSLYDLQSIALAVCFIHGTSSPHFSWTYIAFGIRIAQDVGAHRRKKEAGHQWTAAEDELWKRALWVLVYLDRMTSSYYGRPSAMQDEDFDLDFPIDCDDEYWDTFQQPTGKASKISAFIALLQLCQVLSFALRTIYSINKSKVLLGLTKGTNNDWENRIVIELDAALDKWMDRLPEHLRWNPAQKRSDFFEQSVALHCSYHHMKMIIHRTYIPSPKKIASSPKEESPALAICLHAAKTCSHIVDVYRKRTGDKPLPLVQGAVFASGLLLLLDIWAGKRSDVGLSTNSGQEMDEIHNCMQSLHVCEERWPYAGRLWDILNDLNIGLRQEDGSKTTNKRERGAEQPKNAQGEPEASSISRNSINNLVNAPEPRLMAGHRRPTIDTPSSEGSIPPRAQASGSQRIQTSDVPAITTQFLPHFQSRPRDYGIDTPLSATSKPHERFVATRESHGRTYPLAGVETTTPLRPDFYDPRVVPLGPPETPLSAASSHTSHRETFVPPIHVRDPQHNSRPSVSPDTPLSASSMHGHQAQLPYASSMHQRMNYSHARESFGNDRAGQEYWYDSQQSSAHHSHLGSSSTGLPSFFPMSEAFYEHITSSFNGLRPSHGREEYSSGYSSGELTGPDLGVPRDAAGYDVDEWAYLDSTTHSRMQ